MTSSEIAGTRKPWVNSPSAPQLNEPKAKARKLGFREQQELETLPRRIEELEAEIESLQQELGDPGLYREEASERIATLRQSLADAETGLEQAFDRWAELEGE
jgi:ATP-binding cassette subfamily F protein uup